MYGKFDICMRKIGYSHGGTEKIKRTLMKDERKFIVLATVAKQNTLSAFCATWLMRDNNLIGAQIAIIVWYIVLHQPTFAVRLNRKNCLWS